MGRKHFGFLVHILMCIAKNMYYTILLDHMLYCMHVKWCSLVTYFIRLYSHYICQIISYDFFTWILFWQLQTICWWINIKFPLCYLSKEFVVRMQRQSTYIIDLFANQSMWYPFMYWTILSSILPIVKQMDL
jgi:hypothetical protein